ncbi:MAG: hypothetical protein IPL61_34625 [Myxococcales bacterium]|nr:hypothetical protein [Myxococcales bacterium]
MKQSMFAGFVIATLFAAACGKGSSDPVSTMKGYRDQMCACAKSGAPGNCVPKINVAQKRWEEGLKEGSMSKAQEDQAEALKHEFTACRDTANGK